MTAKTDDPTDATMVLRDRFNHEITDDEARVRLAAGETIKNRFGHELVSTEVQRILDSRPTEEVTKHGHR